MSTYCAYSHFSAMLDRTGVDWWLYMFDFESYWDSSEATPATEYSPAFPMTIAACYISTKEQWDEFSNNWKRALDEEGLAYFHMTDFMAKPERGVKPYCDWDQSKRDRFYYRLVSIINTRIRSGFALGLPSSYDLMPEHLREGMGKKHFTFAAKSTFDLVRHWYGRYGGGKAVQYVFDRMGKGKGEILDIFELMREQPALAQQLGALPNHPEGLAFQDKEFFRPLQAADILAWNMRSFMQTEISRGMPEAPSRIRPYFNVLRKPGVRTGFFRDRDIEQGVNDMVDYEERNGVPAYTMSRKQLKKWRRKHPNE